MKEYYEKGVNLIQGDCLEVMDLLIEKGVRVDAIICDPPYGVFGDNYKGGMGSGAGSLFKDKLSTESDLAWDTAIPFDEMWERLKAIRFSSAANIALFGNDPYSYKLKSSNESEYKYSIIWDKLQSGIGIFAKYQPLKQFEDIMVFYNNASGARADYRDIIAKVNERMKQRGITKKQINEALGTATSGGGTASALLGLGKKDLQVIDEDQLEKLKVFDLFTEEELKLINNMGRGVTYNPQMVKSDKPIKSGRAEKYPVNIWRYKKVTAGAVHPTQKPEDLMEELILTFTNKGDIILDFTMGSGSTVVVAKRLGRQVIGIEQVEKYFDIAVERIKKEVDIYE